MNENAVDPGWKVGDKIRFRAEKQRYTVQACVCNEQFAVLTKPFNCRRTVLYTIVDFKQQIRGTENLIFCMGFKTRKLCEEALERLTTGRDGGKSKVSHRNQVPLDVINQ